MSLTYIHAPITKSEKDADGILHVYGKMTGPDLDLDGQICDEAWLKTAVPEWFDTGANVRLMHQPIAVGVGTELEALNDNHWLSAKIVDPAAVKLVDEGVLTGFSIGIKSPKIVKDASAPNGRIVGGKIVETSLVDRPCNETAKLVLAKMAGGLLTFTEELTTTKDAGPASDEVIAGSVDGADEDGVEVDLIAVARDALGQWLASEAAEVAAGTGGLFVVRLICDLLCDLQWASEADAYDDVAAALAAVKSVFTTPQEDTVFNLTTVADLVKAASADDADDATKSVLSDLRSALAGPSEVEIATMIDTAVTKATSAHEETIAGLSADLAKVKATVPNIGPTLARPSDPELSPEYATKAAKAVRLRRQAIEATDRNQAAAFRAYADELEAELKAGTS